MKKMKNKKLLNKFLAAFLSLAMVISIFPASVLAADGETTVGSSGVVTNKTATLTDDGTYTINLEAYATGSTTTTTTTKKSGEPLDIVLVLDQSGSMKKSGYVEPLKTAVTNFVSNISKNGKEYSVDHRIALVGYASRYDSNSKWANTGLFINGELYNYQEVGSTTETTRLTSEHYKNALVSVNDNNGGVNSSITTAITKINGNGATYTNYGIEMANGIFKNNSDEYIKPDGTKGTRKRIVVVFTDGQPGRSGYDENIANVALQEAYKSKNTYGATVYTVGLYDNANDNVTNFMNYMSSNYPNAQAMNATPEYTPVYDGNLDTNKIYYVKKRFSGSYTAVTYKDGKWYSSDKTSPYTPKTDKDDNDRSRTQFYKDKNKAFDKYYMTTSNSAELDKIFTNISEDVSNDTSSTTITLDAEAELKDIMANGLKMTDSSKITVTTVSGTTTDGETIVAGEETETSKSLTVTKNETTAEVTGFNYSEKYIAKNHPGEILKVEITGVIPSDESVTNSVIDTNDVASGIYDKGGTLAATFPKPQTILTSKAYVLDYAKPFTMSASDWKQTSTALYGSFAKNDASPKYGKLENMTYTPNTTKWDGYDNFYAFGKTDDENIKNASANANGNLWSKVSVIPANNVYYEDDFITNESTGTVGIEYTGEWTTDGTSAGNTEIANGDVQGWEESLADDATYSDGSAHVSSTDGAKASFTFTGKGVDVYSKTTLQTGTVTATLIGQDGTSYYKTLIVDNKSASGEYYQIPTLSFSNLNYGTYKLTIKVTNQAEGRSTYYLDGIRVYNPVAEDETVQKAYGKDEVNAVFSKARDLLQSGNIAFIDEGSDGQPTLGDYTNSEVGKIAPKNEIYLSEDQAIVLKVNGNDSNTYYLGLKAPDGATKAEVTNASDKSQINIGHASDLYYKITPSSDGTIVVKNNGDKLLSITKLRTAGYGENGVSALSDDEAVNAVTVFKTAKMVSYSSTGVTDEELTEQETPEVTEPEENITDESDNVVIENPEVSEETPSETTDSSSNSWLLKLFSGIKKYL